MTSEEIRLRFLKFFEKRGHAIIPSASLVPENDPSVLFNTAGMQPLAPYLLGASHPKGTRLANIQKCVRTVDIEEIGDNTHATFFEMMGNWSLGDYFKREAIEWSYALLTDKQEGFGLDPARLYVTCFEGNSDAPEDQESASIWREIFENNGVPGNRIFFLGADANWWPAVKKGQDTWSGPTGPCSEMFYDVTGKINSGMSKEEFLAADERQEVVEIWNDVFMEYVKNNGKIAGKLKQKNVDTGSGFERIAMVLQNKNNIFDTDIFQPLMEKIESLSKNWNLKSGRIVSDHVRTSIFLISDGVLPSNTDRGYILRRILRRAIRHTDLLGISEGRIDDLIDIIANKYKDSHYQIINKLIMIKKTIKEEEIKFRETLSKGIKEFEKITDLTPEKVFDLYQSYGFPIELTEELAIEKGMKVNKKEVEKLFKKHQDLSRAGSEKKFKGGLGDTSEMSVRYHTATHLLHQALRDVLGPSVRQRGSNITPERLRFDFEHQQKMTPEEKKLVEEIVNEKIEAKLPMNKITLPIAEAEKVGALHFFGEEYGNKVDVYFSGDKIETAYSKEFCGGPHVKNTSDLAGKFKILKEEAVSAGVRRIKAILE